MVDAKDQPGRGLGPGFGEGKPLEAMGSLREEVDEMLIVQVFSPNRFTVGFHLRQKETGHAGGRAVLCWRGFGCAGRVALDWAWDLAVLGPLVLGGFGCGGRCAVGRGFGCARAGLGGVVGALGWVGRRVWYACWAGLGADLAFCVWSKLYMSSSGLHDVFVFVFMCISDVYHFEPRKKSPKARLL